MKLTRALITPTSKGHANDTPATPGIRGSEARGCYNTLGYCRTEFLMQKEPQKEGMGTKNSLQDLHT